MTLIVMKTMTMTVMVMMMLISTSGSLFTFRRLTHGHIIQLQLQTMVGFRHLEIFVVSFDIEIYFGGLWTPGKFQWVWDTRKISAGFGHPEFLVCFGHPELLWV